MNNVDILQLLDQYNSYAPECGGCEGPLVDGTDLLEVGISGLPMGCTTMVYEIEYKNQNGNTCFYHDGISLNRGNVTCTSVADAVKGTANAPDDCNNMTSNTDITITDDCGNVFETTTNANGEVCTSVPTEGCFTVEASNCFPDDCESKANCINLNDIDLLSNLGNFTPTPGFCLAADINGDGGVSVFDLLLISAYLIAKIFLTTKDLKLENAFLFQRKCYNQ